MIIGMVPMSLGLGEGGEQNAPLGRAVIGGLAGGHRLRPSFFVPTVYSIIRGPQGPAITTPGIKSSEPETEDAAHGGSRPTRHDTSERKRELTPSDANHDRHRAPFRCAALTATARERSAASCLALVHPRCLIVLGLHRRLLCCSIAIRKAEIPTQVQHRPDGHADRPGGQAEDGRSRRSHIILAGPRSIALDGKFRLRAGQRFTSRRGMSISVAVSPRDNFSPKSKPPSPISSSSRRRKVSSRRTPISISPR